MRLFLGLLPVAIVGCGPAATLDIDAAVDDDRGRYPHTVELSATAAPDSAEPTSWTWNLGDGTTASGAQVAHTYWGAGEFVVRVTAEDEGGGSVTEELVIDVRQAACPETATPEEVGEVQSPQLGEISGVAESLDHQDVLWVHNDAGNTRRLYALSRDGEQLAAVSLQGVDSGDWEDIARSTDPETGASLLYVGDVGDNAVTREHITVYRLPEPAVPEDDGAEVRAIVMDLYYPDGPNNSETLFVDPITDDVYVVEKNPDGSGRVFRKSAPHFDGIFDLELVAEPTFSGSTTGGDVSPDGQWIIVRTYSSTARLWRRDRYLPFKEAFDGESCSIALPSEPQGESVGFSVDGDALWTISEGSGSTIYRTPID